MHISPGPWRGPMRFYPICWCMYVFINGFPRVRHKYWYVHKHCAAHTLSRRKRCTGPKSCFICSSSDDKTVCFWKAIKFMGPKSRRGEWAPLSARSPPLLRHDYKIFRPARLPRPDREIINGPVCAVAIKISAQQSTCWYLIIHLAPSNCPANLWPLFYFLRSAPFVPL